MCWPTTTTRRARSSTRCAVHRGGRSRRRSSIWACSGHDAHWACFALSRPRVWDPLLRHARAAESADSEMPGFTAASARQKRRQPAAVGSYACAEDGDARAAAMTRATARRPPTQSHGGKAPAKQRKRQPTFATPHAAGRRLTGVVWRSAPAAPSSPPVGRRRCMRSVRTDGATRQGPTHTIVHARRASGCAPFG